jgi:hypothetical protein
VRRHHCGAKKACAPSVEMPPLNRWAIPVKC